MVDFSSRKKRKSDLLVELIKMVDIAASGASGGTAESVSGDTTESKSVDMEEKYLVEKTSFQQKSEGESGGNNTEMMPKSPKKIVTKCTLGKFLSTINFDMENDDDNDILDGSLFLSLPFSFKHMVQVSVRKSFALNIDLGVVAGKLSQKKLAYIRKIFSGAMMATAKLANDHGVVVNTDFKCPINNCINQTIVLKKILVGTSVKTV
ncbi:hypothetical protein G9A89_007212 [Geosiphon pyriformis]|nr:hypothetical protein G9A89_007212 [Geosiphon pyriformis]